MFSPPCMAFQENTGIHRGLVRESSLGIDMADDIEWIVITGNGNREIGALGIIDGKVAIISSFYEDYDGNQDGKVSWGEWIAAKLSPIGIEGMAVTEVAMAARYDMRVLERDPSFSQEAAKIFLQFASGLVADGIYAVYFSRGVSAVAKPIAGRLTSNLVKQFVIRKGMEKAVKKLYDEGVKPQR